MADRKLRVTPHFQRDFLVNVHDCYRLTLVADGAVGISPAIFAFREVPLQPGGAERRGTFSHVCSPVDLDDFPLGAALPDSEPPWYRSATVDLLFRGRQEALDTLATIYDDVQSLLDSLAAADVLVAGTPRVFGDPGLGAGSSIG